MRLPSDTPRRDRAVQSEVYADAGLENFVFPMPRPFSAEDFAGIADKYGISAIGFANQANQVLAENLGNNLSTKIKAVTKRNEAAAAAGTELESLPGVDDLEVMIEAYDFSGVRASSGTSVSLTPFEKIMYQLGRKTIRELVRTNGYQDMPAPVTIAKKDEEPKAGQMSFDDYENEVTMLVEGDGIWAEDVRFTELRSQLEEQARAIEAANAKAAQTTAQTLKLVSQ